MNIVSIINHNSYRISVLTLTILFTVIVFYATFGTRPQFDPIPDVKPVTPALYNEWFQYEDYLNAGIYITNFEVTDFPQGLFLIDAFVWFQFDPLVFSLDTVTRFSIDKGKIVEKEFVETVKVGEQMIARYKVRFEFKSNLNFKYFPLDNHRIYTVFKYDNLAPTEVILSTTFSRTWFGDNAVSPNWKYGEPAADFGYLEARLDGRDKKNVVLTTAAVMYFDFERATVREMIVALLPYVALLFFVLSSLLLALTSFQVMLFTIMGILGMLISRIVVMSMAPTTSYYMLSDLVFFLVLVCALLIIVFEIINAVYKREEETWWFEGLRSGALTLSSMVFLVGWVYLLYIW